MEDSAKYRMRVSTEYKKFIKIFEGRAPEKVELLDGLFTETARIRAELDYIADLVEASGGRIRYNPKNPKQQEVLPASRELEKIRASYRENIKLLLKTLGVNIDDNEDDGLSDYE